MNMAWNSANYLGNLPANIEAAFESAIHTPDQFPGLISNLFHGLLSPDATVGLLGKLLNNAVDPFPGSRRRSAMARTRRRAVDASRPGDAVVTSVNRRRTVATDEQRVSGQGGRKDQRYNDFHRAVAAGSGLDA
jgi:hypothetical protein